MQRWMIGNVNITRIIEQEDTSMRAEVILPEATRENVLPIEWLKPHFIDEHGDLITSIYSLLVHSGDKRIVIDTCVGNDKLRGVPMWNKLQGAFLNEIAAAGFPRESVDYVVCTHLHQDHVGWNTMLVDNEWVPTFPNARYMFSKKDWEWLDREPVTFLGDYAGDSVRPVIEAGLTELFEPDRALTSELSLVSTPGHSPGHISVSIQSRGESAMVTGDLIHHPCQIAQPRWTSPFDYDQAQSLKTRLEFLEHHCDEDTLVIGTHFPTPTAGLIVRDGAVYRFKLNLADS